MLNYKIHGCEISSQERSWVFNYNRKKLSKKERETEDGKAVRTHEQKSRSVERRGRAQRWELSNPAYSSRTHRRISSCPPNAGSFSFQVEGTGNAAVEAETKQVTSTQVY